jgi:hypothetical protein
MLKIIFFIFLYLCGSGVLCCAKTLSELVSDVRLLARDPSSSNRPRFTDSQIEEFINEGQKDVISDTLCIVRISTFTLVEDQIFYNLPSDFIAVERLTLDFEVLTEVTQKQKDKNLIEWEEVTGEPDEYYISFSKRTQIGFYPYPSSSTEIGDISLSYYAQAVDMTNDSDIPFNSISEFSSFHKMIAYYAASKLAEIDGNLALSNRYITKYITDKERFYSYCRTRPSYQPGITIRREND